MINEEQVRLAIDLIKNNSLVEVRVIGSGKFDIFSGYFKNIDNLINEIKRFDKENIYFVLNEIDQACYSREQQERIQKSKNTTSDGDIVGRNFILVDIDSDRAAGVSATDEEKSRAKKVGYKVYRFLRDIGFTTPVSASSGNGYHLLYPIKLANTPENTQLIKDFLGVLDMFFSDVDAKIDLSVFNSSRITRLYGTVCQKGKSTPERPHRVSEITKAPQEIIPTDISLIRKVVAMKPKPEVKARYNNYNTDQFDLDSFISKHHIPVQSRSSFSEGEKIVLDHCLFDHSHKAKDAAIFKMSNGSIGYKCFHNSCADKKWQDVRLLFEPNAYDYKNRNQGHSSFGTKPVKAVVKKDATNDNDGVEAFIDIADVKEVDRNNLVYMKTKLTDIDRKIVGLLKGEFSLISGLSGSGKSTVLGQIGLSVVEQGFKVAIYSGELRAERLKQWVHLQAAGRQFTHPTEYENMYYVKKTHQKMIDNWLRGKFFIYNNSFGNEYDRMLSAIEKKIKEAKLDLLILDSIMTLDIESQGFNSNDAQTKVAQSLSNLAKKYNVHIILITHPHKSTSFLRAETISGSGNLRNLSDNILIFHRVNQDFKVRASEFMGEARASEYENFSNVAEIAKNRDMGVMDAYSGYYFEVESKRFLNEPYENPVFGWVEQADEPLPVTPEMKPDLDAFFSDKDMADAPF